MLLKDFIKNNITSQTNVYIGSRSGWFYIGSFKDAEKKLAEISNKYHDQFEVNLKSNQRALELAPQRLVEGKILKATAKNKSEKRIANTKIKNAEHVIKCVPKQIKKLQNYLDNWVDILEREIREIYLKRIPGDAGYAVLVKGIEIGAYWNVEEWEKENGKINKTI